MSKSKAPRGYPIPHKFLTDFHAAVADAKRQTEARLDPGQNPTFNLYPTLGSALTLALPTTAPAAPPESPTAAFSLAPKATPQATPETPSDASLYEIQNPDTATIYDRLALAQAWLDNKPLYHYSQIHEYLGKSGHRQWRYYHDLPLHLSAVQVAYIGWADDNNPFTTSRIYKLESPFPLWAETYRDRLSKGKIYGKWKFLEPTSDTSVKCLCIACGHEQKVRRTHIRNTKCDACTMRASQEALAQARAQRLAKTIGVKPETMEAVGRTRSVTMWLTPVGIRVSASKPPHAAARIIIDAKGQLYPWLHPTTGAVMSSDAVIAALITHKQESDHELRLLAKAQEEALKPVTNTELDTLEQGQAPQEIVPDEKPVADKVPEVSMPNIHIPDL